MKQSGSRRPAAAPTRPAGVHTLALILGLVLLVACAFLPAFSGKLLRWDDAAMLTANPLLNPPSLSALRTIWTQPVAGLYTPLPYTLWAAVAAVAVPADHPTAFHAINVVLHAGTTVAVYLLLWTLLSHRFAAFAGSAAFAVHPLQVEPVAWVSGMNNVLAGLLGVLALWLYVKHTQSTDVKRRRRLYGLATLAFLGALLSKPTAVAIPFVACCIDLLILRRDWRKVAPAVIPWFIVAGTAALVARAVQPSMLVEPTALLFRPLVAMDATAFYLSKVVWPVGLCIDYGRTPQWLASSPARFVTWIIPVVAAAVCFLLRHRWPWALAALCVFVAGLLPVLGLTPFDFQRYSTVADRYAYLALLGVAILVAAAVRARPRVFVPVAGVAAIAWAGVSFTQSLHWEDETSVMARALSVNPTSLAANRTLAAMLVDAGRPAEGLVFARRAVTHHPRSPDAHANLAAAYMALRDLDSAVAAYEAGLSVAPDDVRLLSGLSAALGRSGRLKDAVAPARRAVTLAPEFAGARANLGTALAQLGQVDEAIAELRVAERLQPNDPMICTNLAALLLQRGSPSEAMALLERALRVDPNFVPARGLLEDVRSRRRP